MYCDWPVLGRCCFCMPLRRGILVFGYINMFFNAFMVAIYSYSVHTNNEMFAIYHGTSFSVPAEPYVAMYCIELIFNTVLLYGAHQKLMSYIKAYYYFSITTIVASVLMQVMGLVVSWILNGIDIVPIFLEVGPFIFASNCIQVYIIILVKSLLRKMEVSSGPNVYDNPLQQIVYEGKTENNGVYDSTVVPLQA